MKIIHVVGARPNFMKAAPVWRAVAQHPALVQCLVHTGQHYDVKMSDIFFTELELPAPDHFLGVGSGSHARQTAAVMVAFEAVLAEETPDLVLVYGDVNSTVAAAIVCAKLLVPVAHVEAGLRSFDRSMPEEINRLITDQIANFLFTASPDGNENLRNEGVSPERVYFVGNVMIDTLVQLLPTVDSRWPTLSERLGLPDRFGLVTLHRPSNVDDPDMLAAVLTTLDRIGEDLPLVFPVHPRTRQRMETQHLLHLTHKLQLVDPLGYLDFVGLQKHATAVITDSGGVQEETTYLGVPCVTVRESTERPVTVTEGTNTLVGRDMARLYEQVVTDVAAPQRTRTPPILWDGQAGKRIADIISQI